VGLDVYLYEVRLLDESYGSKRLLPEGAVQVLNRIEIDSSQHPDHLFKVGYFRSSYSSAGFNRILESTVGETLYSIFDVENVDFDTYSWTFPIWPQVKEKAEEVKRKLEAYIKKYGVVAFFVGGALREGVETERQAVLRFCEEKDGRKKIQEKLMVNYSCRRGDFFFKPLKVMAALPATDRVLGNGHFLVHKPPKKVWDWYLAGLDIVIETCRWCINNPGWFMLTWSE